MSNYEFRMEIDIRFDSLSVLNSLSVYENN